MNNVLEEFRKWQEISDGTITVEGKQYTSALRRPFPPARLKRNAILAQALRYCKANATSATKEIDICWQTGSVKHGTDIIFSCDYEAGKAYFAPLLDIGIAKEALSAHLDRPEPPKAQRLLGPLGLSVVQS